MHFTLIDRILELRPGESITAIKALSLAEEYLQDHFPRFAVMPGVLMLESMYQAAAWLVRVTDDYQYPFVRVKETRNIRYQALVEPGQTLRVTAEILKSQEHTYTVSAKGVIGPSTTPAVGGRLILEKFRLEDENPQYAARDAYAREAYRRQHDILCPGTIDFDHSVSEEVTS